MEADKENIPLRVKTKIPLPLKPLPALPKHLLEKKNVENCENQRQALRTLAQTNTNVPSSSQCKHVKSNIDTSSAKFEIKIDTQYVTLRKKIKTIDEEVDSEDVPLGGIMVGCGDNLAATTPDKLTADHKSVRNIKRSLRRPHSRELQGLSPDCKHKKRDEDKAKQRLKFVESLEERLQTPDYWKILYTNYMDRNYTKNIYQHLLKTESKPMVPLVSRITRACIINWLMKVNGPSGNPAVVQSACWYLDSMLGLGPVQLDKLQLMAAACYWIAQKLIGPAVTAGKLVKNANYAFTANRLFAAEKTVLMKLGFPHQPVVPHDFITYLAWWCNSDHPGNIEAAAIFLCMTGLMVEKKLCAEYPSVIACAAVRIAVESLKGIMDPHGYIMEHLMQCPIYKVAAKKSSLDHTSSILQRALCTMVHHTYEYKTPLEHYGAPPSHIAQQVIHAICC